MSAEWEEALFLKNFAGKKDFF